MVKLSVLDLAYIGEGSTPADALANALDLAQHADPIRIHPSMARLYAQKVAGLETALNDPAIKPEASEILRQMIEKIELTPRKDEPGLDALIHGDLTEILAICETEGLKQEHPAVLAAGHQLSVVAGAGFVEDYTISRHV
jgi:site-specific DNA recombinase